MSLRLAYVFPVCLAARGAGPRWSVVTVVSTAALLTVIPRPDTPGDGAAFAPFVVHALILGGVLHLVGRLESGLSTYQTLATRDALTDLPNRIALERYGPRAVRRATRTGQALCVAMIDCDRFKELNDTYGHAYGDLVLRIIAQCLSRTLTGTGFVARTGGDEFVAILAGVSRDEAEMYLQRAVDRFEETTVAEGLGAGLSFGVAELADGDTLESLLAQADQRMYACKRVGARRLR